MPEMPIGWGEILALISFAIAALGLVRTWVNDRATHRLDRDKVEQSHHQGLVRDYDSLRQALRDECARLQGLIEDRDAELADTKAQVESLRGVLEKERKERAEERQLFVREMTQMRRDRERMQAEIDELRDEREQLSGELAEMRKNYCKKCDKE